MAEKKLTKSQTTHKIADYAEDKGVNLSALSKNTGIPYNAIWFSLGRRTRKLTGDEVLIICDQQGWDPRAFTPIRKKGGVS